MGREGSSEEGSEGRPETGGRIAESKAEQGGAGQSKRRAEQGGIGQSRAVQSRAEQCSAEQDGAGQSRAEPRMEWPLFGRCSSRRAPRTARRRQGAGPCLAKQPPLAAVGAAGSAPGGARPLLVPSAGPRSQVGTSGRTVRARRVRAGSTVEPPRRTQLIVHIVSAAMLRCSSSAPERGMRKHSECRPNVCQHRAGSDCNRTRAEFVQTLAGIGPEAVKVGRSRSKLGQS